MPYRSNPEIVECKVCRRDANIIKGARRLNAYFVDCSRCGDFEVSNFVIGEKGLPYEDAKERALASYHIRKWQKPQTHPKLDEEFFDFTKTRSPSDIRGGV